jgi:HK97 family phage major capsid protein
MSNAVTQAVEAVNKSIEDMRKDNDKSLEALSKGNEARYRELQERCDKQEAQVTELIKARNDVVRQLALKEERIDLLEALADRPKGNLVVKMVEEDSQHFLKWVRSGGKDNDAIRARDQLRMKAMEAKVDTVTIGTSLLGGNAVPKIISDQVDKLILKLSDVVDAVAPKTVGSSDYNRVLSISGNAGGWATETSSRSQGNAPNTRNCKPTWGELYAYLYATNWSLEDMFFNVEQWLVQDIADSHAKLLATSIYSGNGSGQCTGMTNTTPVTTADYASPMRAAAAYQFVSHSGVDTSSPNKLTLDILLSAVYALNKGYRSNGKFAMNSVTQGIARRLKDTTNQYLWQPSVQAGQPDLLFGYPVLTWEDLADGNTVDGFVAAFGDFSRAYELVNRGEMAMTVENVTTPGTTKFYARRRWGGIPYNNDAIKFVRNAD